MICEYKYQLLDGTIVNEKPTDPDQTYTIWVDLIAKDGYILKHKYSSMTCFQIYCTLDSASFWEMIPLDEL